MESDVLITLLNSFAFPVVAFLICCYALKYSFDKSIAQNEKNLEVISTLTQAINNNTITLTELVKEVENLDR